MRKDNSAVSISYTSVMARGTNSSEAAGPGVRLRDGNLGIAGAIAEELGGTLGQEENTCLYLITFDDEQDICFDLDDRGDYLLLNEIEAYPLGQGIGSRFLAGLRRFADRREQDLRFCDVTAPGFFDRFTWLEAVPTGIEHEHREIIDYWYHRG